MTIWIIKIRDSIFINPLLESLLLFVCEFSCFIHYPRVLRDQALENVAYAAHSMPPIRPLTPLKREPVSFALFCAALLYA